MSGAQAWGRCLDTLEAELETWLAVAAGDREVPEVPRWVAPTDLGPLPDELRPRAEALARRMIATRDEVAAVRDRVRGQLARTLDHRAASRAYGTTMLRASGTTVSRASGTTVSRASGTTSSSA